MKRTLLWLVLAALLAQPVRAERGAGPAGKSLSRVTFPAAFTGWTWAGMWDAAAGNWAAGGNENSPPQFSFSGIVSGRWYWMGVWDYAAGAWAFGNWHFKSMTQTAPDGMVLVPGGTNAGTDPGLGAYSLTVSSFYMDRYAVAKALWDAVYAWALANGYSFANAGSGKAANHPVQSVDWYDAVKWCNARSEMEGRTPVYCTDAAFTQVYMTGQVDDVHVNPAANGYGLPTSDQWEYAGRGGAVSRRFPWIDSDSIDHNRANYYSYWSDGAPAAPYDEATTSGYHPVYNDAYTPYTSPVDAFAPNGYGLYGMAGNVADWCFDWYPGFEGTYRIIRGGGWRNYAYSCQVAVRSGAPPLDADNYVGLRCVLPAGQP